MFLGHWEVLQHPDRRDADECCRFDLIFCWVWIHTTLVHTILDLEFVLTEILALLSLIIPIVSTLSMFFVFTTASRSTSFVSIKNEVWNCLYAFYLTSFSDREWGLGLPEIILGLLTVFLNSSWEFIDNWISRGYFVNKNCHTQTKHHHTTSYCTWILSLKGIFQDSCWFYQLV